MHEIAPVGPNAVEPEAAEYLDAPLPSGIRTVGADTPDDRVRHENAARRYGRTDGAREEENTAPVEERRGGRHIDDLPERLSRFAKRTEHARVRLDEHLVVAEPVAEECIPEHAGGHEVAPIE